MNAFRHAYTGEGVFEVNVTAVSRLATASRSTVVSIEWVDEGTAPELVDIKYDVDDEPRTVELYLTSADEQRGTCQVMLGTDDVNNTTQMLATENALVSQQYLVKQYDAIGFYDVRHECWNDFGVTSANVTVTAIQPIPEYDHKLRQADVHIPIKNARAHWRDLQVVINGNDTASRLIGQNVSIGNEQFVVMGENLVEIKGQGRSMFTKVYNTQQKIGNLRMNLSKMHTTPDDVIELTFEIDSGDFAHVQIDFSDGHKQYLYVPFITSAGSFAIVRNHSYAELGFYDVTFIVSNDVSWQQVTTGVSIERRIQVATLSAVNTTVIGIPTVFSLDVDKHVTPAMPVQVGCENQIPRLITYAPAPCSGAVCWLLTTCSYR